MSSPTPPSNAGNQDDPWEQLAEDLFGLEYGKEHAARDEATPPASAAHAPPPPEHPPSESPRSSVPAYQEPAAPPSEPVDVPPRFAAERIEEPEVFVPDEEGDRPEELSGDAVAAETVETARPVSPQDSYWDALANWNWDESEGGSGKARSESRSEPSRPSGGPPQRGGSRGRDEGRGRRGGDRRERQERSSSAPAAQAPPRPPRQTTPSVGDDFGLGVEGEQPGFQPPAEQSATEEMRAPGRTADQGPPAPPAGRESGAGAAARGESHRGSAAGSRHGERGPESGDEGDGSRKRRRRRRRRRGSRGGEGEAGATAAGTSAVPGTDWDDSAGPEADEPKAGNESAAESPAGDTDDERPSRGGAGRRHGRRRYEEPVSSAGERAPATFDDDDESYEPQEMTLAGGEQSESDIESAADDESDDESGEHTINYENVPTWEEAISYLLHPNQVQVESGAGGGANPRGGSTADQPRQTRHIGHRKGRR